MAAPLPIAHLNGAFLPVAAVHISPLDRGFLFGDGVYEVIPAYAGKPFYLTAHLERLQRSLDGIRLRNPHDETGWTALVGELLIRNGAGDQVIYLQVTRGADTGRDHGFPANVPPTVFAMSSQLDALSPRLLERGARIVTLDDIRWGRCDIKAIALLANVLLRQTAIDQECDEAVLVRDGFATEGTASSLFMVHQNTLITPPKSHDLLPSVTRDVVLDIARQQQIPCRETRIPVARLRAAEELWLASSTREVYAVTQLDGQKIGDGRPGPQWRRMHELFRQHRMQLTAS